MDDILARAIAYPCIAGRYGSDPGDISYNNDAAPMAVDSFLKRRTRQGDCHDYPAHSKLSALIRDGAVTSPAIDDWNEDDEHESFID